MKLKAWIIAFLSAAVGALALIFSQREKNRLKKDLKSARQAAERSKKNAGKLSEYYYEKKEIEEEADKYDEKIDSGDSIGVINDIVSRNNSRMRK